MSLLGYVTSVFDTYDFTWLTSVGEFDSLISCTVADKNYLEYDFGNKSEISLILNCEHFGSAPHLVLFPIRPYSKT